MTCRRWVLAVAAGGVLLLAAAPSARQSADHQKAGALLEGLRTRVPEVSRELGWLQNAIPRAGAIPPDVLAGLQELHDAAFTAFKLPDAERQRFFELAKADITVKAEYCRKHPQGMAALVDVTVHTWRPNVEPRTEAKQWNVVYLSAPMAVFADRKGRAFPGFSSPSKRALPPGNYVVWAEDPADASRRGPRKEIQVGDPTTTLNAPVVVDILIAPDRLAPRDRP